MAEQRNFIADRNEFHLTRPPGWWLRSLAEFDDQLVLIPSRQRPVFWLARRMHLSRQLASKVTGVALTEDARMMLQYRIVSIVSIASPTWNTSGLEALKAWLHGADTWKLDGPLDEAGIKRALANGGTRFTRELEYRERLATDRQASQQRETIYHATGDAYRSLQVRLGRTIRNPGRTREGAQRPPSSSAPTGA